MASMAVVVMTDNSNDDTKNDPLLIFNNGSFFCTQVKHAKRI